MASRIGKLGFSTDGSEGNYQRMIELGNPPDLLKVADLMLTPLFEVYSAWEGTALELTAPLVPEGAIPPTPCGEGAYLTSQT